MTQLDELETRVIFLHKLPPDYRILVGFTSNAEEIPQECNRELAKKSWENRRSVKAKNAAYGNLNFAF